MGLRSSTARDASNAGTFSLILALPLIPL
jgi:hypothetical protein